MKIDMVAADSLKPYANNPRRISDAAVDKVAASIRAFGFRVPIVVDEHGVIITGHTRLLASKKLGLTEVPVHVAVGLSEENARAYRIADNRTNEESEWDEQLLKVELSDLESDDFDLSLLGFDQEELAEYTADPMDEGDPDAVPPVDDKNEPASKRGEVYELGAHRLMCGDSTKAEDVQALMGDEAIDLLMTDPPYGMRLNADFSSMPRGDNTYEPIIGDDSDYDAAPILAMWPAKQIALWGGDWYYTTLPPGGSWIVWDKQPQNCVAGPQNHFEMCWLRDKRKRIIIRKLWTGFTAKEKGEARSHPAQKPVDVIVSAIEHATKDCRTIADAYAGSGTTLIAAAKNNRLCRAMEIAPRYCDVIRRRWTKFARENNVEAGSGALE